MQRIISLLMCILLAVGSVPAANGAKKKSKHKKLSKTYVDVPFQDVAEDIAKRTGYTIDYTEAEIDLLQPVTARFKDASAVSALRRILGKQYTVKAKRGVIRITTPPAPPTVYRSPASVPSSVYEDDERIVRTYEDTTFSVACKTVTRPVAAEPDTVPALDPTAKGHYVQAMLGLGYGSMGYTLTGDRNATTEAGKVGKNTGSVQELLQVQYAYYFHENWGVNVGLAFSGYGSCGVLNTTARWNGQGDTDGEQYNHLVQAHNWREHQTTNIVEIPVGIQCMYPVTDNNLRIYAGLGLRVGVPVASKWSLRSGAIEHRGEYPQWGMLITGQEDRDFYTETVGTDWGVETRDLNLKKVALAVDANVGVAIPMTKQIDLLCGLYFQMNCLDLNNYEQQDLGWQQPMAEEDYRKHSFMNTYEGEIASNLVNHVLPWGVGVKVGVQWHHIEKPKTPAPAYEKLQICDTTITLSQRQDTVFKPRLKQLLRKSVIWFDLDSADPKIEPADLIEQIAAILKEHPGQRIIVSGHASKEGTDRHNRILSERRAKAVADLLRAQGVPDGQMSVEAHSSDIGYTVEEGEVHTIALDRRVEIIPVE